MALLSRKRNKNSIIPYIYPIFDHYEVVFIVILYSFFQCFFLAITRDE
ncbi:hypothetical protein JCM19294_2174 [Nonlabens tegetincola]|uniref:Uncharacterized protein n=1 Tax=Nonlabens tegetincola TaxID=323273 RepID=A0A090PZS8_9FLAO|nr:hypothetical protein JCM19294_2174 [Nonlabens tegetincola]